MVDRLLIGPFLFFAATLEETQWQRHPYVISIKSWGARKNPDMRALYAARRRDG